MKTITLTLTREHAQQLRRQLEASSNTLMMPTFGWEGFYNALVAALEGEAPKEETRDTWRTRIGWWLKW